jgi:hypothetical protein
MRKPAKTVIAVVFFAAIATTFLFAGCSGPRPARGKAAPDAARLQRALIGNWAMDLPATADSMARSQFGPQQTVTVSKTGDQPATIRTNLTNKPFNQQEYEKAKRVCLESLRANDKQTWMTFAPGGTGTESALTDSGSRSNFSSFHWVLHGGKLTVEFPDKSIGADFQTEFTDTTQISRPVQFLRACIIFKPEHSVSKTP